MSQSDTSPEELLLGAGGKRYLSGWLFDMEGDTSVTKDVQEYHRFLTDNWDKTQAIIKGKINVEE